MVSLGPDTQSCDFSHMYSFVDYKSDKRPELCITDGSIYDFLINTKGYGKFTKILRKVDQCVRINDPQANITLFVPHDKFLGNISDEFFSDMDVGFARDIYACSSLKGSICGDLMKASPVSYMSTQDSKMRLYVTNISGKTKLNNCVSVVQFDIKCVNGIIHLVDGILMPSNDTFMN